MNDNHANMGAVLIGRNEGTRLIRCIESVIGRVGMVVYVDSGSTDGSVTAARGLNAHVLELDADVPFTAARARNAGLGELLHVQPEVQYVQYIDGDCELVDGWLDAAAKFLDEHDTCAVVCGRRRERHPNATVYNQVTDMEWDTPPGVAQACGGDALMRIEALHDVGGFNGALIAGEEPELCVRLGAAGWNIHRLDHEMTLHDANITQFSQWWRRSVRCGHAYAEGRALHGSAPQRFRVNEVRSIIEWALILPLVAVGFAPFTYGISILLLVAYGLLVWRVRRYWLGREYSKQNAHRASVHAVIGKFAELVGICTFWWNRLWNRKSTLIEYKTSAPSTSAGTIVTTDADEAHVAMEAGQL